MKKEFLTGNEAVVRGALAGGAEIMTGYPITPTTEIIHYWAENLAKNQDIKFLQTEDEMAAGFAQIGAILVGKKAFSATAGPGNVLMQDAFSMAENMRLPTVTFINQRGGPSTGTVIYSQQELNLTCFGGNGEGLRIVYSVANVQEMYDYALKAFQIAWKYRFPTFVLSDGYIAKTLVEIETYEPAEKDLEIIEPKAYLLNHHKEPGKSVNLRNTYNLEEELNQLLEEHFAAYREMTPEVVEFDDYHTLDAQIVIFAHGIVSQAAKQAVDALRADGAKIGLFRPITLRPFPKESACEIVKNKQKILVVESSAGQFTNLVRSNIYGLTTPIYKLAKPAIGITVEEIIEKIKAMLKENK